MIRRRPPPSLVSMWMLDVFCCALGCVTLLWLLNTRLAGDEKARAAAALVDLNVTKQSLLETRTSADATHKLLMTEIDTLKSRLLVLTNENVDLTKRKIFLTDELAALKETLGTETKLKDNALAALDQKMTAIKDLDAKLLSTAAAKSEAEALLKRRTMENTTLVEQGNVAVEKLRDLDAKYLALTKDNASLKGMGDDLAAAKSTIRDLQKKIDDANANMIDLQGDKAKLADKLDKLRIESDARFAGVAMTGRRVVFMVDTSGSMKLVDDKTPAPKKWETVVETLLKVMRSLPDLEQFQIITFSKTAKYQYETGWQQFQKEISIKNVRERLMSIDPAGDTNMYDAFDLAFRLKSDGLDTIYLFSDGLPTSGGLTAEQEKSLNERERTEILTRQIKAALRTRWNPAEGRRVKINSIGFFFESPEVGAFLWSLSRDHDGSFVGMSRP